MYRGSNLHVLISAVIHDEIKSMQKALSQNYWQKYVKYKLGFGVIWHEKEATDDQWYHAPLSLSLKSMFLYLNFALDKLIKEGKRKLARKFNLSYSYTDDLISFNNKRFKELISDIYPKEVTISETTESTSAASYLDLLFYPR